MTHYAHYYRGRADTLATGTFRAIVRRMAEVLYKIYWRGEQDFPEKFDVDFLNPDFHKVFSGDFDAVVAEATAAGEFGVTFKGVETLSVRMRANESFTPRFGFCRTDRREPQDTWVVALFCAIEDASEGFYKFASEGDEEDLAKGKALYKSLFPRTPCETPEASKRSPRIP